ncbi:MAG: TetM/TetW/TetO/TetS family tetracycline resistance ribosomal protection protein [Bacillota bacterium]|nr:TetM/TetW/TetO/TetS family tetracycline resistance ribosomal protection protein [Bacillota bacterium]
MKKVTFAILAHVDAGKTTLSEAMLYHAGVIKKIGRVDKADSFLDYDQQERKRGITIFSKEFSFPYRQSQMTFLDTPGHNDFSCEMERTLQVLDYAILVISGKDGIQSHTKTIWKLLQTYQIPTFIFVNKMDCTYSTKEQLIQDIQNELDENCFLLDEHFLENVSLVNDELLEKYLEQKITKKDIQEVIATRKIYPVCLGSALKDEGIEDFMKALDQYTYQKEPLDILSGIIFKKSYHKQKYLTHLKITGGTLHVKDLVGDCKVDELRKYTGQGYQSVQVAYPGDIVACQGLENLPIGYTFGHQKQRQQNVLKPFMSYQIQLPDNIEKSKAIQQILSIGKEDPSLQFEYNQQLEILSVKIMGEIQLDTLQNLILDRYGFLISYDEGKISYLETISKKVEGVGHFEPLRHYAEVHILLEPLERGSGLIFENKCQRNTLPINFQNLVMTHLQEIQHRGVLTGSPITDMKLTLVTGKAHLKHTEGGDFREATYRAIRQGLKRTNSVLLEPYYQFEMIVDQNVSSKVIYDLDTFHGDYQTSYENTSTIIKGKAPVRYLMNYQKDFLSLTKGNGKLFYQLDGYYECLDQEQIVQEINYNSEEDLLFPTGSVFCKHGAGFYVPYDEVENYMHLPYVYQKSKPKVTHNNYKVDDKELEEIFIRTYGPIRRRLSKEMNRKIEKQKVEKRTILPECLLVDGYNIIFSWDELNELSKTNLDHARTRLMEILNNYQGYRKCLLIVVFDAYKIKKNVGSIEKNDNIYVVYTKEAQTADNYIEKVTHDLAQNYRVYVATSDALEQTIVSSRGAMRISAREFELLVKETHENELKEFNRKNKQMKNYLLEDLQNYKD